MFILFMETVLTSLHVALQLSLYIKEEMVIPTDKETKHIKDQDVNRQRYSEHENTKIKTEQ